MIKEDILEKELVQHRHWIGHIAEAVVKLCTENGIKPAQMEGIFNACRYGTHEPVIDDRPHEDFIMDFEDLEDQLETCRSEFQEALDLLVRARRVISGEFPGRDIDNFLNRFLSGDAHRTYHTPSSQADCENSSVVE